MTGSNLEYTRQISSTSTSSKMEKYYPSELGSKSVVDDSNIILSLPDGVHGGQTLLKRKDTINDNDSGTEEVEQQLEDLAIRDGDYDNHGLDHYHHRSISSSPVSSTGRATDDGFCEPDTAHELRIAQIENDIECAKYIPDEVKKDFCKDTCEAFHGEFARLLALPLSLCGRAYYYLFAEEELKDTEYSNLRFDFYKLDNAKAQFKCPNPNCLHAWTSMRARIMFSVTAPTIGFVVLKIFGQHCIRCGHYAQALWYIDEACRVMKNLAYTIYKNYFSDMLNDPYLKNSGVKEPDQNTFTPKRHDPEQRKGKMFAPHAKEFCEACRRGVCYL